MTFTALVMAASRGGAADALARAGGTTHKSLVKVAGIPMLTRVIAALSASPSIGRIYVSTQDPTDAAGTPATVIPSRPTLADSVIAAAAAMGDGAFPLLITTADNALHTPAMIEAFCAATRNAACDVTVAMTPAEIILARYPTGARAFHPFKDGPASSCNLYALCNPRALAAAQSFAGGGQFGKKPWRLIGAFGVATFALYKLRRLTLDDAMRRIGRAFGLNVRAVRLMYAEAPIDIDTPEDLALAEKILATRVDRS